MFQALSFEDLLINFRNLPLKAFTFIIGYQKEIDSGQELLTQTDFLPLLTPFMST